MTASPGQRLAAIVPLPSAEHAAAVLDPLAGQSPLARVVRDALVVAEPASVVVGVAEPFAGPVREHLAREGMTDVGVVVAGTSATRAQCLAGALARVVSGPAAAQLVLVYDVRQPLASPALRDRVVERLRQRAPAVLPVWPVTDSVKSVDERGAVIASLDRSILQTVQYPRGFAVDDLARMLSESVGGDDEAYAAIRAGVPIVIVDGDAEAIAVDLPHDIVFLEAVIASRRPR